MRKPINSLTESDVRSLAATPRLDHYQHLATKSAIYPGQGTVMGVAYCALKLNGEAGELAEHVGKAMRDDDLIDVWPNGIQGVTGAPIVEMDRLTDERRQLIIKEIGDVLWYLSALCNELGTSLTAVALTNLRKLASRSDRGKLQGSGDNR